MRRERGFLGRGLELRGRNDTALDERMTMAEKAEEVYDLLNKQINEELYSAYLYLTFADYYDERGLKGYANWYMVQVQEELAHAKILRRFLLDHDYSVKMFAIAEPDLEFDSDLAPLKAGLAHEKHITDCINKCYSAAAGIADWRTVKLLDWYIQEQGEEETNASDLIKDYELFGTSPQGLYALDQSYLNRTFVAPTMAM